MSQQNPPQGWQPGPGQPGGQSNGWAQSGQAPQPGQGMPGPASQQGQGQSGQAAQQSQGRPGQGRGQPGAAPGGQFAQGSQQPPGQFQPQPRQPGQFQPQPGQVQQPGQFRQQPQPGQFQQPRQPHPVSPHPHQQPGQPPQFQHQPPAVDLADGDWHRLHPLSPWSSLIGVVIGVFFACVFAIPGMFGELLATGRVNVGVVLLVILGAFVVIAGLSALGIFLGYRATQFRLTDEVFELRQGVISKKQRQVRLDRLQSVNLNRAAVARIFGLTQLETSGAGQDSDIKLSYLAKEPAERLRGEILRRASGAKRRKRGGVASTGSASYGAASTGSARGASIPEPVEGSRLHGGVASTGSATGGGSSADGRSSPEPVEGSPTTQRRRRTLSDYIDDAVLDFAGPELPEGTANADAVVNVAPGRIAGATALGGATGAIVGFISVIIITIVTAIIVAALATGEDAGYVIILGVIVAFGIAIVTLIGTGFGALGQLLSSMNYTIAGTPDGVRIGRGLLNQTSDTVPPGRIHSVQIAQPWLWRPFKWYQLKVDRADLRVSAESDSSDQSANLQRQIMLPVGTWQDIERVLALVLPMHMSAQTAELLRSGMQKGQQPRYTGAPQRAWWLHPFAWRRLGYAIDRGVIYLRHGWLHRRVAVIPGERIQSVTIADSPLERAAGVVTMRLNTVGAAVRTGLHSVEASTSVRLFDELSSLAVATANADSSHRWAEAQARSTVASAHMAAQDAQRAGKHIDPRAQRVLAAEAAWRRDHGQDAGQGGGPAPVAPDFARQMPGPQSGPAGSAGQPPQHGQPGQPMQPGQPLQPGRTTRPGESAQPGQPMRHGQPGQQAQSMHPGQPVQSGQQNQSGQFPQSPQPNPQQRHQFGQQPPARPGQPAPWQPPVQHGDRQQPGPLQHSGQPPQPQSNWAQPQHGLPPQQHPAPAPMPQNQPPQQGQPGAAGQPNQWRHPDEQRGQRPSDQNGNWQPQTPGDQSHPDRRQPNGQNSEGQQ